MASLPQNSLICCFVGPAATNSLPNRPIVSQSMSDSSLPEASASVGCSTPSSTILSSLHEDGIGGIQSQPGNDVVGNQKQAHDDDQRARDV